MGKISDEDNKAVRLTLNDAIERHKEIITIGLYMKLPIPPSIAYNALNNITEKLAALGFTGHYCCTMDCQDNATEFLPVYIIPKADFITRFETEADLLTRLSNTISDALVGEELEYQKWKGQIPILVCREGKADRIIEELTRVISMKVPDPLMRLMDGLDHFPAPYNKCRIVAIKTSFSLNPFYVNGFQHAVVSASMAKGEFIITDVADKGFTVVIFSDEETIARCEEFVIWAWDSFVKHTKQLPDHEYPVDGEDGYLIEDVFNIIPQDELANACRKHQIMILSRICKAICSKI